MKTVTLREITLNITDGKHGDCEPAENSGYYFVSCKDVNNGTIDYANARQISERAFLETHKRTQLEPNDILITNSGTIGRMALVKDIPETYRTTFQKSVAIVKPDISVVLPTYLYYKLQNCVTDFVNCSNGSAQKNLLLGTMRKFQIDLHEDFAEQERLSSILAAYDNLIENNQKRIKLLEEAAQRLYKEWFVDLRFPGYEDTPIVGGVPEGWEKVPVGNLISYEIGGGWGEETPTGKCIREAYVIRGTDLYGIAHGDLLSIPFRYHVESNLSSRKLKDGDIVFEVSGGSRTEGVARCLLITSSMLNVWRKDVMCASFCKLIRPQFGFSQYLHDCIKHLRATGKTEEYDKRSASSIVNYRWKDFLSQELVLRPSEEILDHYNGVAKEIYSKAINCSLQIESAKKARDRLLPKLMSGEIEV